MTLEMAEFTHFFTTCCRMSSARSSALAPWHSSRSASGVCVKLCSVLIGIVAWLSTECWEDPAMDRATIYSLVRKLNERSLGHGS